MQPDPAAPCGTRPHQVGCRGSVPRGRAGARVPPGWLRHGQGHLPDPRLESRQLLLCKRCPTRSWTCRSRSLRSWFFGQVNPPQGPDQMLYVRLRSASPSTLPAVSSSRWWQGEADCPRRTRAAVPWGLCASTCRGTLQQRGRHTGTRTC